MMPVKARWAMRTTKYNKENVTLRERKHIHLLLRGAGIHKGKKYKKCLATQGRTIIRLQLLKILQAGNLNGSKVNSSLGLFLNIGGYGLFLEVDKQLNNCEP